MLNLVQMTDCVVWQCIILSLITCVSVLAISTGSLSNHDGNGSKSFYFRSESVLFHTTLRSSHFIPCVKWWGIFLEFILKGSTVDSLLRWLHTVFQGQYLPSLSINYVAINKVLEKLPPQLYQMKMKICYDQGCKGIGVVIATK